MTTESFTKFRTHFRARIFAPNNGSDKIFVIGVADSSFNLEGYKTLSLFHYLFFFFLYNKRFLKAKKDVLIVN